MHDKYIYLCLYYHVYTFQPPFMTGEMHMQYVAYFVCMKSLCIKIFSFNIDVYLYLILMLTGTSKGGLKSA